MIPPRHLPLTQRKALCGRLLYLDAVNRLGLTFPADDSYKNFNSFLLSHIDQAVLADSKQRKGEAATSLPAKPLKALDLSLRDVFDDFKGSPAYKYVSGDLPSKKLMNLLDKGLGSVSCVQCSAPKAICEGVSQSYDDGLVHNKGNCISQLRQMFEVARDAAQGYYTEYGQGFPVNPCPEIVFSTARTQTIPTMESPLHDFYASAVTKFIDESGKAIAEAKLRLEFDADGLKLDLYTYKGILYVMFHECIAHAFHGLLPTFVGREATKPFDSFAEGFMDHVAFEVLKEALADSGHAARLNLKTRIAFPDALKAAAKMNFERNEVEFDEVATPKTDVSRGVKGAEALFAIMRYVYKSGVFGPSADFKRGFYRLAFDLNMRRDLDPDGILTFLSVLYDYSTLAVIRPEDQDDETLLTMLEIQSFFVKYLQTGQLTQLLKDVQAFTPLEDLSN